MFFVFWIFFTQIDNFRPTFVIYDSILFRGYVYNDYFFNIFLIANFITIIYYIFSQSKKITYYVYFYLPFIVILSTIPIAKEINTYAKANEYDNLGKYLSQNNKILDKNTLILGEKILGEDYRIFFNLDFKEIKKMNVHDISNVIEKQKNIFLINHDLKLKYDNSTKFLGGKYLYIE